MVSDFDNPLREDWTLLKSRDVPMWRKIGIAALVVPLHLLMYLLVAAFALIVPAGIIYLLLRALG